LGVWSEQRKRRIANPHADSERAQKGTVRKQTATVECALDECRAVLAEKRVAPDDVQALDGLGYRGIVHRAKVGGGHGHVPATSIALLKFLEGCPVETIAKVEVEASNELLDDEFALAIHDDVEPGVHGQRRLVRRGQDARYPAIERLERPNEDASDGALTVALKGDAADVGNSARPIRVLGLVAGGQE